MDNAKIHMQIDIGFGDLVHPEPIESSMPSILDLPSPTLLCYSKESVIAEKFEAMIKLGEINSRMKDFYDIWLLSRQFNFAGNNLSKAIKLTFNHRRTPTPENLDCFSHEFATRKQTQWSAFRSKLNQDFVPKNFIEILEHNNVFLSPIVSSVQSSESLSLRWAAPNKWID